MATPRFLQSLVDLSSCETLEQLLGLAVQVLEREIGVHGRIELWDREGARFVCGAPADANAAHRTWIGIQDTIGAIHLKDIPSELEPIELLARQLAPLGEWLMDRETSRRRTIREDIDRLYERRIRDALVRCDWNASAVARELYVSRARVASVARRWRSR
jgi:hypothetical protein